VGVCHKEGKEKKKKRSKVEKKGAREKKRKSGTFLSPETMIRACFTRKSSSPDSVQSLSPKSSLHLLLYSSSSHIFFFFSPFFFSYMTTHTLQRILLQILADYWHITHTEKEHNPFPFKRKLSCDEKKARRFFSKHTVFTTICTKTWIIHIQKTLLEKIGQKNDNF